MSALKELRLNDNRMLLKDDLVRNRRFCPRQRTNLNAMLWCKETARWRAQSLRAILRCKTDRSM